MVSSLFAGAGFHLGNLFKINATKHGARTWILMLLVFDVARKVLFLIYLGRPLSGSNSVGRMPASGDSLCFQ